MGNCFSAGPSTPPPPMIKWDLNGSAYPAGTKSPPPRMKQEYDEFGVPVRRETESGVPGLTYDQAGRPVWRDPKIFGNKKTSPQASSTHIEKA